MHVISRTASFRHAINGLVWLFRQEPNFRIHCVVSIGVIAAGIFRELDTMQWVAIVFAIGIVWTTEALNTCIEVLCNIWCENKLHPEIKTIKDIAAGAVLVSAAVSIIIGILVFFF